MDERRFHKLSARYSFVCPNLWIIVLKRGLIKKKLEIAAIDLVTGRSTLFQSFFNLKLKKEKRLREALKRTEIPHLGYSNLNHKEEGNFYSVPVITMSTLKLVIPLILSERLSVSVAVVT